MFVQYVCLPLIPQFCICVWSLSKGHKYILLLFFHYILWRLFRDLFKISFPREYFPSIYCSPSKEEEKERKKKFHFAKDEIWQKMWLIVFCYPPANFAGTNCSRLSANETQCNYLARIGLRFLRFTARFGSCWMLLLT